MNTSRSPTLSNRASTIKATQKPKNSLRKPSRGSVRHTAMMIKADRTEARSCNAESRLTTLALSGAKETNGSMSRNTARTTIS